MSLELLIGDKLLDSDRSEVQLNLTPEYMTLKEEYDELLSLYDVLWEDRERLKKQRGPSKRQVEFKDFQGKLQKVQIELLQTIVRKQENKIKELDEVLNSKCDREKKHMRAFNINILSPPHSRTNGCKPLQENSRKTTPFKPKGIGIPILRSNFSINRRKQTSLF